FSQHFTSGRNGKNLCRGSGAEQIDVAIGAADSYSFLSRPHRGIRSCSRVAATLGFFRSLRRLIQPLHQLAAGIKNGDKGRLVRPVGDGTHQVLARLEYSKTDRRKGRGSQLNSGFYGAVRRE